MENIILLTKKFSDLEWLVIEYWISKKKKKKCV